MLFLSGLDDLHSPPWTDAVIIDVWMIEVVPANARTHSDWYYLLRKLLELASPLSVSKASSIALC